MTSVNTNVAALSALRNLQATNTALDKTQSSISTGLKIESAKDNAAYWSISTTMKSDNKAMSTVSDALGLGSATVDTAYEGLNAAKDVLDEIKSKLTSATQAGVDRKAVQDEIDSLKQQLKSIATSSTFSGENWLSINSSTASYSADKNLVASFTRDASGNVSIGTITVKTADVALFDASSVSGAGGIIDSAVSMKGSNGRDLLVGGTATTGNTNDAGLTATATAGVAQTVAGGTATADDGSTATAVAATTTNTATNKATYAIGTFANTSLVAGDKIVVSFKAQNGAVQTAEVAITAAMLDATPGTAATAFQGALDTALTGKGASATVSGAIVSIESDTAASTGVTSSIQLMSLEVMGTNGKPKDTPTLPFGAGTFYQEAAYYKTANLTTTGFDVTDKINFDLTIDDTALSVTVPASSDGVTAVSVQTIADSLNANGKFSAVATASIDGTKLVITSITTGDDANAVIDSVSFTDADAKIKSISGTGFAQIASAASYTSDAFQSVTLDENDNITFDIQVNAATKATTVSITKDLVNKTLGETADGTVATAADYAKVVNAALKASGVTGVEAAAVDGVGSVKYLQFTSTTATRDSLIKVSNVEASGGANEISVEDIDITADALSTLTDDEMAQVLSAYIDVVNAAIDKVTSAAAGLGAVASRIDLQKTFVTNLMDTIEKGVSGLVDADMNEESTKLQALQVKQQLGVQALSIANQSAQNVLSLFQ